jgi:hypothetical protein
VEPVAIAAIVILSVSLGLAGACVLLSMVFLALTPSSKRSTAATVAHRAFYGGAYRTQTFGRRAPGIS